MTALGTAVLPGLEPGTARVQADIVGEHETLLRLSYPNGLQLAVSVPDAPRRPIEEGRSSCDLRPMAVLMINGQATLDCSVLCSSTAGPTRMPISLADALALCDSGVHTVLRSA